MTRLLAEAEWLAAACLVGLCAYHTMFTGLPVYVLGLAIGAYIWTYRTARKVAG